MIDPILSQGCKALAPIGMANQIQKFGIYECLRDRGKRELVGKQERRNFIRSKIGVSCSTPNAALRGDTGFRPLYPKIFSRCLHYLQSLEMETSESLMGTVLRFQKNLHSNGHEYWYSGLKKHHD